MRESLSLNLKYGINGDKPHQIKTSKTTLENKNEIKSGIFFKREIRQKCRRHSGQVGL